MYCIIHYNVKFYYLESYRVEYILQFNFIDENLILKCIELK